MEAMDFLVESEITTAYCDTPRIITLSDAAIAPHQHAEPQKRTTYLLPSVPEVQPVMPSSLQIPPKPAPRRNRVVSPVRPSDPAEQHVQVTSITGPQLHDVPVPAPRKRRASQLTSPAPASEIAPSTNTDAPALFDSPLAATSTSPSGHSEITELPVGPSGTCRSLPAVLTERTMISTSQETSTSSAASARLTSACLAAASPVESSVSSCTATTASPASSSTLVETSSVVCGPAASSSLFGSTSGSTAAAVSATPGSAISVAPAGFVAAHTMIASSISLFTTGSTSSASNTASVGAIATSLVTSPPSGATVMTAQTSAAIELASARSAVFSDEGRVGTNPASRPVMGSESAVHTHMQLHSAAIPEPLQLALSSEFTWKMTSEDCIKGTVSDFPLCVWFMLFCFTVSKSVRNLLTMPRINLKRSSYESVISLSQAPFLNLKECFCKLMEKLPRLPRHILKCKLLLLLLSTTCVMLSCRQVVFFRSLPERVYQFRRCSSTQAWAKSYQWVLDRVPSSAHVMNLLERRSYHLYFWKEMILKISSYSEVQSCFGLCSTSHS
ncbi:endochitinase A-like [Thalassophryne amazonica]|uniref:endochitinase A-like n=1 Tax=Thalassophryne amazonica TaxID=390379 RepID=UPI0014721364|nr:endochitinase A-like [Thalassophryne amazonica]